jgi:transcriptional regulator with XRE-family HTH domain
MNLKDKIIQLLEVKKLTYNDLANHLGITDEQLNHALETKTLEVRTLELISKELRIPLYSFFRDEELMNKYISDQKKKYYDVNIWSDQETLLKNDISILNTRISDLEREIAQKNELIFNLEKQLKKG